MFKKIKSLLLITLVVGGSVVGCGKTTDVNKDKAKVTLVLSVGGVNDQSFNQGAWEGAKEAAEELGVEVSYLESNSDADYMQNIETAVDEDADLVVGVGFQLGDAIKEAAEAYPEQSFAIIDSTYDEVPENVRCITFNEEQAGYAAGLVASKMTKTGKVGFVGGMDIPSCSNFSIGFKKAMEEVLPESKTLIQFTNSFTDAAKGRVVAEQMVKEGRYNIYGRWWRKLWCIRSCKREQYKSNWCRYGQQLLSPRSHSYISAKECWRRIKVNYKRLH